MKVNVQNTNFNVDQKLIDFIGKKLTKLERYYDKIIYADVFLKVQKTSGRDNKIVEILLSVPGNEFMVKKQSTSFEAGTDNCTQSLQRQLMKQKEKKNAIA